MTSVSPDFDLFHTIYHSHWCVRWHPLFLRSETWPSPHDLCQRQCAVVCHQAHSWAARGAQTLLAYLPAQTSACKSDSIVARDPTTRLMLHAWCVEYMVGLHFRKSYRSITKYSHVGTCKICVYNYLHMRAGMYMYIPARLRRRYSVFLVISFAPLLSTNAYGEVPIRLRADLPAREWIVNNQFRQQCVSRVRACMHTWMVAFWCWCVCLCTLGCLVASD